LRDFLDRLGHELVVLTDKESELDRHLPSTDVLIPTPFWPAYVTKERISNASNLSLILTAGLGSDHIDWPLLLQEESLWQRL
jgi:formate dehydrogenase